MCSVHAFLSDVKLQMLYINSKNPFPLIFSSVNYNVVVLTSFSTLVPKHGVHFTKDQSEKEMDQIRQEYCKLSALTWIKFYLTVWS